MNESADPCEDFSEFVCGKYYDKTLNNVFPGAESFYNASVQGKLYPHFQA